MRADMDNYLVILCILLPVTWSQSQSGSVSVRINISWYYYKQYITSDVLILSPQSAQYENISTECLQQYTAHSRSCRSQDLKLRYQTRKLCYKQVTRQFKKWSCTSPYTGMLKAVIEGRMEFEVNRKRDKKSVIVSVSCISNSYKLLFNDTELTRNKIYWRCVLSWNSYYHYCYTSYSSSSGSWTYSAGSIREFSCRPVPQPTTQPATTSTTLITQSTTQPATTATTIYPTPSSKSSTVQSNISTTTQPAAQTPDRQSTSEGVNGLNGPQTANMNSDKGDNSSVGLISGISAAVVVIIIIIITVLIIRRRKTGEQDNRENVVTHQNNVYESDYSSQPACDTGVDDDNYNILHHRVRVRNDDIYQEGEDYFQLEHSNRNRAATGSYHLVEPPQRTNQNADQEETTPNENRVVQAGGVEELYSEVNKDDRAVGQASSGEYEVMLLENDIYEGAQVDDEEVVYSLAE